MFSESFFTSFSFGCSSCRFVFASRICWSSCSSSCLARLNLLFLVISLYFLLDRSIYFLLSLLNFLFYIDNYVIQIIFRIYNQTRRERVNKITEPVWSIRGSIATIDIKSSRILFVIADNINLCNSMLIAAVALHIRILCIVSYLNRYSKFIRLAWYVFL